MAECFGSGADGADLDMRGDDDRAMADRQPAGQLGNTWAPHEPAPAEQVDDSFLSYFLSLTPSHAPLFWLTSISALKLYLSPPPTLLLDRKSTRLNSSHL